MYKQRDDGSFPTKPLLNFIKKKKNKERGEDIKQYFSRTKKKQEMKLSKLCTRSQPINK